MFFGNPFGGGSARSREVDNNRLYERLGVAKDASIDQIKKAYRNLARTHHPDRGGDAEEFKEIAKAYEILSDEDKRRQYDEYGEDFLNGQSGEGGGVSAEDIFASFFGGGMRRGGGPRGKKRGDNVVYPLNVTLDDLYNGKTTKLRLTKKVICQECQGKGGKADAVQTCQTCRGSGTKVVIRQVGPGMIQQMHTTCSDCSGEGEIIRERDRCKGCKGKKVIQDKRVIEVVVEKGMQNGEKIVFSGEADEAPDTIPGDVIVVLQQVPHERFKRKGHDLIMIKTITLVEALTGFQFAIQHLDSEPRVLLVRSEPGHVYKQGEIKAVLQEGMPKHKRPFEKGTLYIQFNIEFPPANSINSNQAELLKRILPGPQDIDIDVNLEHAEEVALHSIDPRTQQEDQQQQRREAYEDDEEGAHEGPRVGCQQQ